MAPNGKSVKEIFENVRGRTGIRCYRIQDEKLLFQSRGNFGTFHGAEKYVIFNIVKERNIFKREVYLWIGEQVDKKEREEAMNIIIEAEEFAQKYNIYIQHQFNETQTFFDMLPHGVKYLKGYADDFKQFENGSYVKRLFQVKGKKNVRVFEVDCNYHSLNEGDSFILDDEWIIYCWNGRESNKVERLRALETAIDIRDGLCYGKADVITIDAGRDEKDEKMFFKALGRQGDIKPRTEDDEMHQGGSNQNMTMYKISSKITATEGHLVQSMLDTQEFYLLDGGRYGMYGWIGAKVAKEKNVFGTIKTFMSANNFGASMSLEIYHEGHESKMFKGLFTEWKEVSGKARKHSVKITEESKMIDNATGPIKVWRIEGFNKVAWPVNFYGFFYEGDCYLVHYNSNSTQENLVYIWQGSESSDEEQLDAFHFAQELADSLKGPTTQVSVVHGRESEHFLTIFKGKLIILTGGIDREMSHTSSTAHCVFDLKDGNNTSNMKLFHIKGTTHYNTRAKQIPVDASMLQSDDVFLLQAQNKNYIWEGKLASHKERDFAEIAADRIAPDGDLVIVQEGFEPKEFWEALGGRVDYNKPHRQIDVQHYFKPRLHHCTNEFGEFSVTEIYHFNQKDLNSDDVMILDIYKKVYVWVGNAANKLEKEMAWETAIEFIENDDRNVADTEICQIKQGYECQDFISLFDEWDPNLKKTPNYDQLKKQTHVENLVKARAENNRLIKSIMLARQQAQKRNWHRYRYAQQQLSKRTVWQS